MQETTSSKGNGDEDIVVPPPPKRASLAAKMSAPQPILPMIQRAQLLLRHPATLLTTMSISNTTAKKSCTMASKINQELWQRVRQHAKSEFWVPMRMLSACSAC